MSSRKTQKEQLVELLRVKNPLSPKEIAVELDISENAARGLVRRTAHEGLIQKVGYGQYGPADELPTHTGGRVTPTEIAMAVEHYDALLSAIEFPIAMFDTEARFIMATDSFLEGLKLTKYKPIEGKTLTEVFPRPAPRGPQYIEDVKNGKTPTMLEAEEYELEDGSKVWLAYRTRKWFVKPGEEGGFVILVSFGDSKERVEQVANIAYDEYSRPAFAYSVSKVGDKYQAVSGKIPTEDAGSLGKQNVTEVSSIDQLADLIVSTIGDEVFAMVSNMQKSGVVDRAVQALDFKLLRVVNDEPVNLRVRVDIEPMLTPEKDDGDKDSDGQWQTDNKK